MKRFLFSHHQLSVRRSVLIFSFTSIICFQARAQLLGGFFSQQSRKQELMAAQNAAYQLYLAGLKGGIHIAQNGLTNAYDFKNSAFGLHAAYFNSLEQISPAIQNNAKAKAIAEIKQQIIKEFSPEIAFQQKINVLTVAEQNYIRQVYESLLEKCNADLAELHDIMTPGRLQLSDEQRLERIDHLYAAMQEKLAFTGSFTAKCHQLALLRQQAAKDRQTIRKLYGGGR